jgi:hypothetical protein
MVMAEEMKNVDNCDNDETEVAVRLWIPEDWLKSSLREESMEACGVTPLLQKYRGAHLQSPGLTWWWQENNW